MPSIYIYVYTHISIYCLPIALLSTNQALVLRFMCMMVGNNISVICFAVLTSTYFFFIRRGGRPPSCTALSTPQSY